MKNSNLIEKTFLFTWPVAFIASVLIYLISGNSAYMISYILGVASVMMMQSLNYRMMKDLYKNNPAKIKSRTIMLYIVRFVFYAVILYVVVRHEEWNVYFALGGLLTFQVVLIPVTVIFADKGDETEDEL